MSVSNWCVHESNSKYMCCDLCEKNPFKFQAPVPNSLTPVPTFIVSLLSLVSFHFHNTHVQKHFTSGCILSSPFLSSWHVLVYSGSCSAFQVSSPSCYFRHHCDYFVFHELNMSKLVVCVSKTQRNSRTSTQQTPSRPNRKSLDTTTLLCVFKRM